jgi:myo-inositol 2-dehydrogenase/D-chiro-inositol 1-dehydrogenase
LHIISRDPEPPGLEYTRLTGGILLDMTIHDFDMARYLMVEEVQEIYTAGSVLIEPKFADLGEIDTALITLRFQSGALGVIDNSCRAVYGYDQRVEVFGEKGQVVVRNPKPNTTVMTDSQGYHAPPLLHFFIERYTEAYVAEMKSFIDSILNDRQPAVTGQDGLIAVQIAIAARKSLETGKPVQLSEIL